MTFSSLCCILLTNCRFIKFDNGWKDASCILDKHASSLWRSILYCSYTLSYICSLYVWVTQNNFLQTCICVWFCWYHVREINYLISFAVVIFWGGGFEPRCFWNIGSCQQVELYYKTLGYYVRFNFLFLFFLILLLVEKIAIMLIYDCSHKNTKFWVT